MLSTHVSTRRDVPEVVLFAFKSYTRKRVADLIGGAELSLRPCTRPLGLPAWPDDCLVGRPVFEWLSLVFQVHRLIS